jgi:hypothetical protein
VLTGRVAIVGSTNRGDPQIQADTKTAAYHLGGALAGKHLPILVYYDEPIFIEAEVVHGYLDSGMAEPNSIEVRYPEKLDQNNVPKPPPFAGYVGDPRFSFRPDRNREWEISFYQSLEDIGGMLVLQGGSSTLIAGLIALGYNKPLLACPGFGGTAVKLSSMLFERGTITAEEVARLRIRPAPVAMHNWADDSVSLLLDQSARIEAKKQEQGMRAASVQRRQVIHMVVAATLAAIAFVLCVLNWDNSLKLSVVGIRSMIFLIAGLAGGTGAMLWNVVPFLRRTTHAQTDSTVGAGALGFIVGCLATLIYLIAQEHGFPDLAANLKEEQISVLKANYLARLIPSALVTALIGGMTLDRAFRSILKRRPFGD